MLGMATRGIRGATTVRSNEAAEIVDRTLELLGILIQRNGIRVEDVASAVFTVTDDLDREFPAIAVRGLPGWDEVPLLCGREIPVPGSLGHCIRILLHWNTDVPQFNVRHAFLRGARELRPAWAIPVPGDDAEPLPPRIGDENARP
jgi:chorismate mutase